VQCSVREKARSPSVSTQCVKHRTGKESAHLDVAMVVDQHVVRFEIAMDHAILKNGEW
jgi:hypothetical protein